VRAIARTLVPSRGLALVLAGAVTCLALLSAWHSAAPTWRRLNADYRTYSAYSKPARAHAASEAAGFNGSLFDFLASHLRRGDRIYYQVPRTPYGTLDLHDTVAALGNFYLLPAVQVSDPEDATVVVSYDADPARLGRTFVSQLPFGPRIFLSRISQP
jgi:hypothetical protein